MNTQSLHYGAFTTVARLHATKIRTIGKIVHILQQNHRNHCAIKVNAHRKCLKQNLTPVAYNLVSHVTSM